MNRSHEYKTVLVLGGYGAVGSAVCEELKSIFPGRIVVAGRNLQKAQRLAQRLGERVEPAQVDAAEPSTYQDLLRRTSVVVNCVERNNFTVAEQCLAHSVHYIEVSATVQLLEQLQSLQPEAERANATAVLSVGVAPGLTNLLARYARSRLGPLAEADLFVLLGLGEVHGEAAIRWTLQNLGKRFPIVSGGIRSEMRSFGEGRSTKMPEPFGKRTAYRFDISDQHTLPHTLGIETVNTWLCFDSRLATHLLRLFVSLRLSSFLPLWRASGLIAKFSGWFKLGGTGFVVQVDATGVDGARGSFALTGDGEAQTTGLVAAHVAKHLLSSPVTPGILHIEQLLSLDALLSQVGDRLSLVEI